MPVLFIGHGNPMNAISDNSYTREWEEISRALPRPRQILSVSAHWFLPGSRVTIEDNPRTIHDFGGFPEELYATRYPAPGAPGLARRVRDLLAPIPVGLDDQWGLDHGTWSVLSRLFPGADIPVVQLAIDETLTARDHFALAKRLAVIRDEGVLILGSGNVVHNLHAYAWGRHSVEPFDWALRFDEQMRTFISAKQFDRVVDYEALGKDAALAAPTPEHFLPLVYVLAQHTDSEPIAFPVEGFDGGSVSMLSVRVG